MSGNIFLKKGLVVAVILLFISVSVIPSTGTIVEKKSTVATLDGNTLYVGGSGPGNYTKIQDAIDNASDGDTVFVFDDSSPYYETLIINKSINLIGENRDTTVIDGSENRDVMELTADLVDVSGFTIQNSSRGIRINSNYNTITCNNILKNFNGIYVYCSSDNIIDGNVITNNSWGMYLYLHSSGNNTVSDNIISGNSVYGIDQQYGSDNIFTGNTILDNSNAIRLKATSSNTVAENTISGIIDIRFSSNNIITENIISDTNYGINIYRSSDNIIDGNVITNNGWGMYLYSSGNNNLSNNTILENEFGISISSEYTSIDNNIVVGNYISRNRQFGIRLEFSSKNNIIYHNNLINNSQNAYDECSNTWAGNYYDDYTGPDADRDGIGDVPYNISGNSNQDLYPLMYPWYPTHPDIVYINDDYTVSTPGFGYDRFNRIQYGVNEVQQKGVIYVFNGTYYENVVVDKSIDLIGEDKNSTVIDGSGVDDVVYVSADKVSMTGFTVENSGIIGGVAYQNGTLVDIFYDAGLEIRSNSNSIFGNIIGHKCGGGILIKESSDNSIFHNKISKSIILFNSNNNVISSNNVSNNFIGISLYYSSSNIISENNIYSNDNGLLLNYSSNNNKIYHNNFIENVQNAYDECNNSWDNGYPSCGNYWDNYSGTDYYWGSNQSMNGSDGVGDSPYNIAGDSNQDRYPLIEPYGMTKLTFSMGPGLFKFSGIIKNIGNKTAFNVQWKITIDGGFIIVGRHSSGTLPKPLLPGEETTVSSKMILGFGKIMITVAVWADNAPFVSGTISGFVLLFFIKINPGGGI